MSDDDTVTISFKRYTKLLDKELQLETLLAFGVDKWEGYNEAMESLNEEEDDLESDEEEEKEEKE